MYTERDDSSLADVQAIGEEIITLAGKSPDTGRGRSNGAPPAQPARLHFPDGSSRLTTSSPYAGARSVAAAAAFGITTTEDVDERATERAFIEVTEIRPTRPRPGGQAARAHVVRALIAADDKHFHKRVKALCASRVEVRLAQRVRATRNTDPRTTKGREDRARVGRQVRELRSR
jgi:hypothetical protein